MRLPRTALASVAATALLAPTAAIAATPSPGTFKGTTSQTYKGKRGTVKATVSGLTIKRLDIDVKLVCDQKGAVDTAGLFVTRVRIAKNGKVVSAGSFDRKLTSADGKPVVGTYTATLRGTFTSKTRFRGTLDARVVYKSANTPYATCKSGTVRFTAVRGGARKKRR